MDEAPDETKLALGQRVTGRVCLVPKPHPIGIFVDIGFPAPAFVDVLRLSDEVPDWPTLGTVTEFEVVDIDVSGDRPVLLRLVDPRYGNERAEQLLRRLSSPGH